MLSSRERVVLSLNHKVPDRIPVDLGGSVTTGIHASALDKLKKVLHLEEKKVKVYEPMMMLGLVEEDVLKTIGSDVIGLNSLVTLLGYKNINWKPWKLPDGTEVLIGEGFNCTYAADGIAYTYPKGNININPSAKMPAKGFYFDNIIRQENLSNHKFNARKDYSDQFNLFSEEELKYFEDTSKFLYKETDYAIFGNFFLGGVGDIFHIPAPWLEKPRGIRDLNEWMMAHIEHPEYVKEFFDMQVEIQMKNLKLYYEAVQNRISIIAISGTDFGSQNGLMFSPEIYRKLYKPYHKIFNDWVHKNTEWKVFFHTCGSIVDIMEDLIEVGVDVVNPVQFTAAGMDLEFLKDKFGERIVFWGGGINPQKTFPFGTPEEVKEETKKNVSILSKNGGYICSAIHNIQSNTPVENIISFFKAVNG